MVQILIVEKSGSIKELKVKETTEEYLCKKAGFKNNKGFGKRTTWDIDGVCNVVLYGKIEGRAGQENKYDFPPPVDSTLFFGACVLVCVHNDKVVDLNEKTWKVIYEKLFGGFEDLGEEDSEEEEDEDEDVEKTKEGYAKDGFVVEGEEDDEEEEEEEDEDEDEEEEEDDNEDEEEDDDIEDIECDEEEDSMDDGEDDDEKPKRIQPKRQVKNKKSKVENIFTKIQETEDDYLNCESELEEEEYE